MSFDQTAVVAGTGTRFILSNATLNSGDLWPSDTIVELYLAPPLSGGIPYPPTAPSNFGAPKGYAATVTATGASLSAQYTTTPVGSGYAGDLDVTMPGYWARWWRAYSASGGLDVVIGWCSFLVKQSPRLSTSVPNQP